METFGVPARRVGGCGGDAAGPSGVFRGNLKVSGRFDALVADAQGCIEFERDVLGTVLLRFWRASRDTALSGDGVNPALLGMGKVASEDSVRRGVERIGAEEGTSWPSRRPVGPLLVRAWIATPRSSGSTRHQEGAVVSYNPTKPGRFPRTPAMRS